MKTLIRLLVCLLGLWLAGVAAPLMAAPLDKARAAYSAGDYKKASSLARKAGKKLKSKGEKAEAMAFMAASMVKLGKSNKGRSRFVKALKLDPNLALPSEMAGDTKVGKAFAKAQKKAGLTAVADSAGPATSDNLSRSAPSAANRSPSNFKNYLPLGLNSIMQGKLITGIALGGLQGTGLFLYMSRTQAVKAANADAASTIDAANENDATEDPKFIKFIADNNAFVKKAKSEASLWLIVAAMSYGASVVDSIFDPFGTGRVATSALDSSDAKVSSYADLGGASTSRSVDSSWKFDLELVPTETPGLLFTMKQSF